MFDFIKLPIYYHPNKNILKLVKLNWQEHIVLYQKWIFLDPIEFVVPFVAQLYFALDTYDCIKALQA